MAYLAAAIIIVGALAAMTYLLIAGHPWGAFAAFIIAASLEIRQTKD